MVQGKYQVHAQAGFFVSLLSAKGAVAFSLYIQKLTDGIVHDLAGLGEAYIQPAIFTWRRQVDYRL